MTDGEIYDRKDKNKFLFVNILFIIKIIKPFKLVIQLSTGKIVGGMLFADDFVGFSDLKEILIDVYSKLL